MRDSTRGVSKPEMVNDTTLKTGNLSQPIFRSLFFWSRPYRFIKDGPCSAIAIFFLLLTLPGFLSWLIHNTR